MEQHELETEHILFNYFKHLKLWKYFFRSDTPQKYCKDYEMKDISVILNNMNLTELEQTTLVYYGFQLKPPRTTSRYHPIWQNTIKRIADEFRKHKVIQ